MKILSINKAITYNKLYIETIQESELSSYADLKSYAYIIVNGGDGTIRRVVKILHSLEHKVPLILNPTGSFNVIAKMHRVPKLFSLLETLGKGSFLQTKVQPYYTLNGEVFLFSAGNMGDLQHILLSESLRFGLLNNGMAKYMLSVLFLLPVHLVMTPFMLLSKQRFFIFTPFKFIRKFGSFYGKVEDEIHIDLANHYNHIELDGDVVTIEASMLTIKKAGNIRIVT